MSELKLLIKQGVDDTLYFLKTLSNDYQIVVFGTGSYADILYENLCKKNIQPFLFFDNNATESQKFNNIDVDKPSYKGENIIVIIASSAHDAISKQLLMLGYDKKQVIYYSRDNVPVYPVSSKVSLLKFGYMPARGYSNEKLKMMSKYGFFALGKRLQARYIMKSMNISKDDIVLDFGCAVGYFAIEFAKKAKKTYGVDIGAPIENLLVPLKLANKLEYLRIKNKLPFPGNHFDKIFMSEVISMLPDPDIVLQEIYRVLKPKGKLLLVSAGGRPWIEKAYSNNSGKINKLKKEFPETFPATFEEYEQTFQSFYRNATNHFLSAAEIVEILKRNKYNVEKTYRAPSDFCTEILHWWQFKNLLRKEDLSHNSFFYLKFILLSLVDLFCIKRKYSGFLGIASK